MYIVYFPDAETRLLFKFRLGTHCLNEELGKCSGGSEKAKWSVMCVGRSVRVDECVHIYFNTNCGIT